MTDKADMTTFADLGIAFPLFEAPVRACASHVGPQVCPLCNTEQRYFQRISEVAWVGPCPDCGTTNRRTADEGTFDGTNFAWRCSACEANLTSLILKWAEEKRLVCYRCVKERGIKFVKDTEFGMVDPGSVSTGITGGVPGLAEAEGFELVVVDENWNDTDIEEYRVVSMGVRIDPEHLRELLRTPTYFGWQEETWLFCCRRPMIFVGHWFDVVRVLAPPDRGELFRQIYETVSPDFAWPCDDYQAASSQFEKSDPEMYVFRCPECQRLRGHVDCS